MTSNSLPDLAHKINVCVGKADDYRVTAACHLAEAKRLCKEEGKVFKEWVVKNIEFSYTEAVRLATAGGSDDPEKAIADMRQKTKAKVQKHRAKVGLRNPTTKPPKPHPKSDQIIALSDAGKTRKEIAEETGIPEDTLRREIERVNIRRAAEAQIDPVSLPLTAQQKLDAAVRQQTRKQSQEFELRVADEVKKRTATAFPHLKSKQERADKISASYTPRFSKKDCNDVARCLHPDTWQPLNVPPELASRLKSAFVTFTKMQKVLCVE